MSRPRKPASPFRYFNSSPEVIRLVVMMYEARARFELNPWIVEAALVRLGSRRLSQEEQREVWNATRTPHKVNWPKWWVIRG